MLINVGDVADGVLINAIALTGRRVSVAVRGTATAAGSMTWPWRGGSRPSG